MADKAEKKEAAAPDKGGAGPGAGKPPAGAEGADKAAKGAGMLAKTPVVLGVVMVLEAVVLFAGFKFLGGGAKTAAGAEVAAPTDGHGEAKADGHGDEHGGAGGGGHDGGHDAAVPAGKADKKRRVELAVVDFRAPNKQSGRTFLYDVAIYISIRADTEEKTKAILNERSALIKDRVRTIIAQSDPEKLGGGSEPGLETLRRQVKYQLDEIIGEGVIDEVLVPRCIPFPVSY
jgi:flagellar basal body-associated protein FliL